MSKISKNTKIILVLLLLCVVIAVVPVVMLGGTAEFGGSDDAAEGAITEIDSSYTPWFTSPFAALFGGEIPGELESLLFCLQAAAGSGIFFYILGRLTMRSKMRKALLENGIDISKAESSGKQKAA